MIPNARHGLKQTIECSTFHNHTLKIFRDLNPKPGVEEGGGKHLSEGIGLNITTTFSTL